MRDLDCLLVRAENGEAAKVRQLTDLDLELRLRRVMALERIADAVEIIATASTDELVGAGIDDLEGACV